jgi:hypothetical protein
MVAVHLVIVWFFVCIRFAYYLSLCQQVLPKPDGVRIIDLRITGHFRHPSKPAPAT